MIIYLDGQPQNLCNGDLGAFLQGLRVPMNTCIALDTEASGLFIDGDWHVAAGDCQPPARVSAVSMAWFEDCSCGNSGWDRPTIEPQPCADCDGQAAHGPRLRSIAIPFDQGRVTGKPGLWDHETNTFKPIKPLCTEPRKSTKAQRDKGAGDVVTCNKPHDDRCHTTNKSVHKWVPDIEPIYNASDEDWRTLLGWLNGRPLVFHNAKYDLHVIRVGLRSGEPGIDLQGQFVWDTQIVQGIIEPPQSNALKPTARRLWGEHEGDEKEALDAALKLNGTGLTKRYDLVDWSVIGPYAAKDAELTIRLFEYQQHRWETGQVEDTDKRIIEQEFKLTRLLYRMEMRGLPFKADDMAHEANHMQREVKALEGLLPWMNCH